VKRQPKTCCLVLAGMLVLLVSALLAPLQIASAQGATTANLTIFTSLTSPSGQPVTGQLAGYSYTLTGQNGLPTQTVASNQLGQAAFPALAPGIYSLSETPLAGSSFGSMTINGVAAQQQQPFQLQAGGTYNVNVTNIVNGSANVSVQVQLLDSSGQAVNSGNLGGYTFSFSGQSGAPISLTSSASGQVSTNLPPGAYTIVESAVPGSALVTYTINGVPTQTGQFTVGLGQTTAITAVNRVNTNSGTGLRAIALSPGCNNLVSTFADGTTGQVLASAVAPSTSVSSIWRFDNAAQAYRAVFFPAVGGGAPPPVDVSALSRLDAVFICSSGTAILNEPNA
jgi:hypothetical protein